MRYGKHETWFASLEAEGYQVERAAEMPDMRGLEWLWMAWLDLGTCRPAGWEVGVIPWTAVERYAARYALSGEEFEMLWYCVQHLDSILLDHLKTQSKSKRSSRATERNTRRRNRH